MMIRKAYSLLSNTVRHSTQREASVKMAPTQVHIQENQAPRPTTEESTETSWPQCQRSQQKGFFMDPSKIKIKSRRKPPLRFNETDERKRNSKYKEKNEEIYNIGKLVGWTHSVVSDMRRELIKKSGGMVLLKLLSKNKWD